MNTVAPGQPMLSITRNDDSVMYQLFLGYSFTSFLALEANAFRLGQFGYNVDHFAHPGDAVQDGASTCGAARWTWSASSRSGDSWRIYGRVGATW